MKVPLLTSWHSIRHPRCRDASGVVGDRAPAVIMGRRSPARGGGRPAVHTRYAIGVPADGCHPPSPEGARLQPGTRSSHGVHLLRDRRHDPQCGGTRSSRTSIRHVQHLARGHRAASRRAPGRSCRAPLRPAGPMERILRWPRARPAVIEDACQAIGRAPDRGEWRLAGERDGWGPFLLPTRTSAATGRRDDVTQDEPTASGSAVRLHGGTRQYYHDEWAQQPPRHAAGGVLLAKLPFCGMERRPAPNANGTSGLAGLAGLRTPPPTRPTSTSSTSMCAAERGRSPGFLRNGTSGRHLLSLASTCSPASPTWATPGSLRSPSRRWPTSSPAVYRAHWGQHAWVIESIRAFYA